MTESPIFSINNVEVVTQEKTRQLTGNMINAISHASKLLEISPEEIKGFVIVAITDNPIQDIMLHQYAMNSKTRLALYGILPNIQKLLLENFKKEINPEGLV